MNNFYSIGQFIVNRYDLYFTNVNNKGSYYLAVNTFLVGGIAASYSFLITTFEFNATIKFLIAAVILLSFISIALSIFAINPILKSNNSKKYQSLLFFGSVAEMKESEVIEEYEHLDEKSVNKDFAHQIYILASGLALKYKLLKWAGYILIAEFFIIAIIITSLLTLTK